MLWVYTRTKDKFDGPKFGGLIHGRRGGLDYIRNEKYLIQEKNTSIRNLLNLF